MSIVKYVTSLLPSFERSRVEEDIRILKEDLVENTLPPYAAAVDHFKRDGFKSRDVADFDRVFGRSVRTEISGNFVVVTHEALVRANEMIQKLDTSIDKYFGRDVTADGMTYTRLNVLRYVEAAGFAARYARKVLLWTYTAEKTAMGRQVGEPFTRAEVQWLHANRQAYFACLRVLATKPRDVEKFFRNIPDMVVVPEEVEMAKQTVGEDRLDPLQTNLIPVKLNPIYHVRMAIADWQVSRYKAGQEEKRALEYRLLALQETREGKSDAKLEQMIEYTEDRLKKLNYKLAKIEED
jgi:hypothetical protein